MRIISLTRFLNVFPCRSAIPYSVTTKWTSPFEVVTPAPGVRVSTILDIVSFFAVDGNAMMACRFCCGEAPRMKSTCPPNPENILCPIESAQTWPVKSTWIAELMENHIVISRNRERVVYKFRCPEFYKRIVVNVIETFFLWRWQSSIQFTGQKSFLSPLIIPYQLIQDTIGKHFSVNA